MYVDALHDRKKDRILVAERVNGVRIQKEYPVNYSFYYESKYGPYETIYGDAVDKKVIHSGQKFHAEKKAMKAAGVKLFESDINVVFKCLEDHYTGADTPSLNLCFFDIEVAVDPNRGFAPIDDTFNPVTAISVYLSHTGKLITLAVPPPTITFEEALAIQNQFDNTFMYESEAEMLDVFLTLIQDSDVISGWNSTGYDIPYMVGRINRVLGEEENDRWCLWGQPPKHRTYEKFKKKSFTYDLVGRVHLDYLELYQKHNPQQLHSYRLDFVGEIEVGENKTPYEGTLDDLYKKDFFKFIEYNRQDVMLLVKIDKKKKFIELANQIAHVNTVLLKTTMGSVALIEQAIILHAHSKGKIGPDANEDDEFAYEQSLLDDDEEEEEKAGAVGAYVARPKTGFHEWIGCCDINSLYPSTLRALNMSPETLFAQLRQDHTDKMIADKIAAGVERSDLWEGVFSSVEYEMVMSRSDDLIIVDFVSGDSAEITAKEVYEMVFASGEPLCLSANGTIFRTDISGTIPSLLAEWYADRKIMQAREKIWNQLSKDGFDLGDIQL